MAPRPKCEWRGTAGVPDLDLYFNFIDLGAKYSSRSWNHPIFGTVVAHIFSGPPLPEGVDFGVWSHYPNLEEAVKAFDHGNPRAGAHYWHQEAHVYFDGCNYALIYV